MRSLWWSSLAVETSWCTSTQTCSVSREVCSTPAVLSSASSIYMITRLSTGKSYALESLFYLVHMKYVVVLSFSALTLTVGHHTAHQSLTLPADDICALPVDITWQYHVTSVVLSVLGLSLLQVRWSGTRYRTVSMTWCSLMTVSDSCWKWTYSELNSQHTQCNRDASWLHCINSQLTLMSEMTSSTARIASTAVVYALSVNRSWTWMNVWLDYMMKSSCWRSTWQSSQERKESFMDVTGWEMNSFDRVGVCEPGDMTKYLCMIVVTRGWQTLHRRQCCVQSLTMQCSYCGHLFHQPTDVWLFT